MGQTFKVPTKAIASRKIVDQQYTTDPAGNLIPMDTSDGFLFTMEFSKWVTANYHNITLKPFADGLTIYCKDSATCADFQKHWG